MFLQTGAISEGIIVSRKRRCVTATKIVNRGYYKKFIVQLIEGAGCRGGRGKRRREETEKKKEGIEEIGWQRVIWAGKGRKTEKQEKKGSERKRTAVGES